MKKKCRHLMAAAAAFALTVFVTLTGAAVPGCADELPDLSRQGSITIIVLDSDTREPVEGGTIAVYRVADLLTDGTNYSFVYTEEFSSCTSPLTLDDEHSPELALELSEIAETNQIEPVYTGIPDITGTVPTTEVPLGLYLVVQTEAPEGYGKLRPYLITLPYRENDGSLTYDVVSYPKPGTTAQTPSEPSVPSEPAKPKPPVLPYTGQLWWPVIVLAAAGSVLIVCGCVRRKKAD